MGLLVVIGGFSLATQFLIHTPQPTIQVFKGYFVDDFEARGFYPCGGEILGFDDIGGTDIYEMYQRVKPDDRVPVYVELTGELIELDEPVISWDLTEVKKYVDIYDFSNMRAHYNLMCGSELHYLAANK